MKKIILVILILVILVSCKKDRTCICKSIVNYTDFKGLNDVYKEKTTSTHNTFTLTIYNSSKSKTKSICNNYEKYTPNTYTIQIQ